MPFLLSASSGRLIGKPATERRGSTHDFLQGTTRLLRPGTGYGAGCPNRSPPSRRGALRPNHATDDDTKGADGGLSTLFGQFVQLKGIRVPPAATQCVVPSPLVPPNAVVNQVMEMLQRNDWPEADAGVSGAFQMTLPASEEQGPGAVRSWQAEEEWLSWPRFHALLHVSYGPLLNCDGWQAASPLLFPSSRHENRAVQAVEVRARPRPGRGQHEAEAAAAAAGVPDTALRSFTYTFCLERQESGPFKDCWLISGVRVGNYAV